MPSWPTADGAAPPSTAADRLDLTASREKEGACPNGRSRASWIFRRATPGAGRPGDGFAPEQAKAEAGPMPAVRLHGVRQVCEYLKHYKATPSSTPQFYNNLSIVLGKPLMNM